MVSKIGYKLIDAVAEVTIPRNTGDFRIMHCRVIEELRELSESHGFLRGLVSLVGFSRAKFCMNAMHVTPAQETTIATSAL